MNIIGITVTITIIVNAKSLFRIDLNRLFVGLYTKTEVKKIRFSSKKFKYFTGRLEMSPIVEITSTNIIIPDLIIK